ncbi:MAG: hypothetical protein VXW72_03680, partial [Candidatus Thermoplasmatota archaeon]|nr:hypothetical protein [Candidatus Thermoplasmatota archaeon]
KIDYDEKLFNHFTLSRLNYVTEEYHSHRRLIPQENHSKTSTLEYKIDYDEKLFNHFTLSRLNYVTEEYHSHRRLIDTARKTHSKKSTLENRYENQGTRGIAKLSDGTNLTRCHVR